MQRDFGIVGFDVHGTLLLSLFDALYEKYAFVRDVSHSLSESALFVFAATLFAKRNEDLIMKVESYKTLGYGVVIVTNVPMKHAELFKFLLKLKGLDLFDDIVMRPSNVKDKLFKTAVVLEKRMEAFYDNDREILTRLRRVCGFCRVIGVSGGEYHGR